MSQNGQTHFKNFAAFAARFLKCLTILGHYAPRRVSFSNDQVASFVQKHPTEVFCKKSCS